ncbi:quinone oxidoreductase family protein [Actinokineospora globicatena]|uniref:Quinone oxidoreductase n=1 Tax=Actinokineospora globicatena TaxID=103729 RepID=A0A9W6QNU2_9PSEU|nr:quinone oxidoreductase [Actinokineospora globicatena]MCP2304818.1 NADPH2:quinone reductase [Actinokineospora globicatena]GLW77804.1 quinone oxidoreductase [Actinokineospora globicatena]GLW85528.1 quinone oxidoreductase [Actinokineospora globicatena]GLW94276.1 quinone oxidoreductase [Actinokineospora globicatena]
MPKAIVVSENGGPEVLTAAEVDITGPGAGALLVRVAAAGVNYIDTYQRGGAYPVPLPFTPGLEGAGTVEAVGDDVTGFAVGDRVAWTHSIGSYAEQAVIPATWAVRVPDGVDDEAAAAALLQGLTAHYLVASTYPVAEGDTILVHAAAGGVGLLLVQLAKARGARVIGTVSTPDKERLARAAGADEVIRYTEQDFVARTRELTGGEGVAAVYDGVGATTFDGSLAVVRRRGVLALFGAASGPVPPVDPQRLNAAGSVFLTRPTLADYLATPQENQWRVDEVFGALLSGALRVEVTGRYPLADARQAHEDLEGRRTTGKLLLIP